ncbi:MAG: 2-oxoglutarate dehydrogenase complex dihydrolipoyllysine-residue succinyltransferase [Planctomycetes bacterium]|nr:2-oxoglutarate dehydrogenase complex dihydrolipoyllysine-residue succinyltransferase [Planctomycetota bacterium]
MPVSELKVPSVGESITEVQIGDWLVGEGASAGKDDALVVIETDKVTVELPAPIAGKVTKVLKKKGDTATVGEVIGYMEAGAAPAKKAEPDKKPAPSQAEGQKQAAPAKTAAPNGAPSNAKGDAFVMPAAQRALATSGIDAKDVTATGPGNRMLKEDVQRTAAAPRPALPSGHSASREEEIVPMTPMRRRIAERLVQAQNTAALLTTFNEIDMGAVMALRGEFKDEFQKKHGSKLGFMSFFVKASIEALKLIPQVNAEIKDNSIVYKNYYDIGVAVGGGKGLVVPILRNAERMSFAEVEAAIADLGTRAQANKLTLDELQGGTFTISNGGIYGSLLSTPILNPPQSGILGLHAIQERPVARDGQVVIRPIMYVALTYDHRIVDGREAVTFLKRIKECLENPARMLLEI